MAGRWRLTTACIGLGAILLAGCGGSGGGSSAVTVLPASTSTAIVGAVTDQPAAGSTAGTAAVLACPELPAAEPAKDGLPSLPMSCLSGGKGFDIAALRGVPTVLNVWAAWCSNCAREMPLLNAAAAKAGDRVRFIGVHAFAETGEGRDAATRFPVRFPSLQDPGPEEVRGALHVPAPPYTFLIRADGSIAYRQVGEILGAAQLEKLLTEHLGVRL
jgi:thiol-disulfide isomerase/thioredoxin